MNVSLSKPIAQAMPAKTFLPDAGTTPGKFSTVFADVKDTTDPSMSDAFNDGGNHAPKKMSAKSDKSNAKPSGDQASPTSAQTTHTANSAALQNKPLMTSMVLPFALQEESQTEDSDTQSDSLRTTQPDSGSTGTFQFQFAFTDSRTIAGTVTGPTPNGDASTNSSVASAVVPGQPEPKKMDSSDPAADNQQVAASSTNLLSVWAEREANTSFKTLIAPAAANGRPAAAETKTVSADTARGTTSTLDNKTQSGLTFLQSHSSASSAPPMAAMLKPAVRPSSNSDTERESLQSRALSGSATGKQEKAAIRALADVLSDDVDGASDEATQFDKVISSAASSAGNDSSVAAAAAPGSAVSTQISTPVVNSQTATVVASPKTSDALPQIPSIAAAEDANAAVEAAALATSSPLQTAKLVAGIERSELRMGLRTGEFGNVDIRTSLVRNQFTAEISAERGELGRALAAELPGLQHRLTEQHLPAASITVLDHSGGGSSDSQQGSRPGHSAPPADISANRAQQDSSLPILAVEATEATARLDIHM